MPFLIASLVLHLSIFMLMPISTESRAPIQNDLFDVDFAPQVIATNPTAAEKPQKNSPGSVRVKKPTSKSPNITIQDSSNQAHTAGPEATVSLNSSDAQGRKYGSYIAHLRAEIDKAWEYPVAAREQGLQGTLTLRFAVNSDGSLGDMKILQSSKQAILDQEALRTIQTAAPFRPLPQSFALARLNVLATFTYQSQSQ